GPGGGRDTAGRAAARGRHRGVAPAWIRYDEPDGALDAWRGGRTGSRGRSWPGAPGGAAAMGGDPMTQPSAIVVPQRFRGPPSSGNGGWTAGAIACATVPGTDNAAPWPAVTVSLHLPPPLDTELTVTREDDVTVVTYGDQV